MIERWRPVVGWEKLYDVSNRGNVRSKDRIAANGRLFPGQQLKLIKHNAGYWCVCLSRPGDKGKHLVHRLVYSAFIEPLGREDHVDHEDRNRGNNSLGNLRRATPMENLHNAVVPSGSNPTRGVCYHKQSRKFMVRIKYNYQDHYIGIFASLPEAIAAREAAEKKYFGRFAPNRATA